MRADNDNYPPVLTRPQAAAMCNLTPSGFDSWVRRGIVPTALPGTRRWSRDAILKAVSGDMSIGVEIDPYDKWKAENARKKQKR